MSVGEIYYYFFSSKFAVMLLRSAAIAGNGTWVNAVGDCEAINFHLSQMPDKRTNV